MRNTLEVEALPMDLPRDIKIDISSLTEDGMALHISDITVGDKVTLLGDPELTVLSTIAFRVEVEEEETPEEGVEEEEGEENQENKEGEETKE